MTNNWSTREILPLCAETVGKVIAIGASNELGGHPCDSKSIVPDLRNRTVPSFHAWFWDLTQEALSYEAIAVVLQGL